MAQFTPLVSTAEFAPVSYDDYMKPHLLAEAAYQNRRQLLDQGADALAAYLPYLNDATPEARKLYDDAQAQINRNVSLLGTKGWNLNPEPLIAFKDQYRKTNAILNKAATTLEELQKADKEAITKDNSLFVRYKNKAGDFIQPNIDSMITNDYERHTVSGSDIQDNAKEAAQALSKRTKAAFATFAQIGQTTGYYSTTHGSMAGVSNAVMMDWLINPDQYKEEIGSWLQNVKKFGGQHSMDTMKELFNGEFKKALEGVVDRTDYDNMEQSDKIRLNKYLMTGAYQGLSYDESLQRHDQPFDNTPKDTGGHGGGAGGAITPDIKQPKTDPRIYISDDKIKREIYQKIKRYFGFDDSMFTKTGIITLPTQMALVNRNRVYGGDDDYSKADEFINTIIGAVDENGNPKGSGIFDYFSLFDDNGNILNTEAFKKKYEKPLLDIRQRDYYEKHRSNQDFGKEYHSLIQLEADPEIVKGNINENAVIGKAPGSQSTVPVISAYSGVYEQAKSAILDLYEVSESEKKKIMEDKTGELYDDFIKKNKITKADLTNRVIDMADRYANITVDQQYATFPTNNEDIIRDVIKNSQVTDGDNKGKYTLNVIENADQFTFKTETYTDANGKKVRYKTYKIKPGYEKHLDESELFYAPGDDKNKSYKCFYYIPADPSQGIIVQFPSGVRSLIPSEKLGSLYNSNMIATWTTAAKEARATMTACVERIKEINLEVEKINGDKNMSEADKTAKLVELQTETQALGQAYQNAQNAIVNYRSEITKSFVDNISSSYKPNNM